MVRIGADPSGLEAGFKKADGYIKSHEAQFRKVGRGMTIAGAAITAVVGGIVKKASDAQETYSKFGTVFNAVSKKAEISAKNLALGYGLSTLASKDMLSATGDLLTGLGVLPDVALDLSEQTQKLAADLASFTNYSGGAKGASEALTKAMLGERESIKSLGIVITEEMVNEKLAAEGKAHLTGLAKKQAQAQATLTIAYEQSQNAVGDYARTSGDLANVGRSLMAQLEDLAVGIGTQLIPVVTAIMTKIKEVVGKVTEWVKENPKLTGTIAKIVAVVGILLGVFGPLVMMLPALSAGFIILWGAITGPVGLVIAAVAAVAAAAYLIYKNWGAIADFFKGLWDGIVTFFDTGIGKLLSLIFPVIYIVKTIVKNWEPIKEFFGKLWTSVSGFFVEAFDTIRITWGTFSGFFSKLWKKVTGVFVGAFDAIKTKLIDFGMTIVKVMEKIPFVKKLAIPLKDALQTMRNEMDETVANISVAATEVTAQGMAMAEALVGVVRESGLLEKASGLLGGVVQKLGGVFKKTGEEQKGAAKTIAKANKTITSLTEAMFDEIRKATLDEYTYAKWALKKKLDERIKTIRAEQAGEAAKNTAIALANESYRAEQAALEAEHRQEEADRLKEATDKYTEIWGDYWDAVKKKQKSYLQAERSLRDSINQLTMGKLEYAIWALDEEARARDEAIEEEFGNTEEAQELLLLSAKDYAEKKKKIIGDAAAEITKAEQEAAEAAAAAWKQSLENTLADVGMILNAIGGLFQMAHENQMIRIDNEEKRTYEALDNKYDAHIRAANDLLTLEQQTSAARFDELQEWYETQKKAIEDSTMDEEEKAKALRKLDNKLARKRKKLIEEREVAEKTAADALEQLEYAKNEALRIAAEDLEDKRSAARKTAAKQEKAVALLSAIVNTAAAVAKALPNIPLAIAVGVLGAIQIALIKAQPLPLKEGGLVTQPTHALIGEAGPELVIPLSKLQPALAGAGGGGFNQYNYFYGDINEAGDLDEISRQLAEKTRRALERGRL
jgi:hypothetical protein